MRWFALVYWAALVIEIVIRAPVNKARQGEKMARRRVSAQEQGLLGLLTVTGMVLPLVYSVTPWLSFADYALPGWAGWAGTALMAAGVLVFWRGHADLGVNWSPSLEIREKHELVTRGIYSRIRHPMYAAQWLMAMAQVLLLPNFLAGWLNMVAVAAFYFLRVRAEETLMLETFGKDYRAYMQRTGRIVPKL